MESRDEGTGRVPLLAGVTLSRRKLLRNGIGVGAALVGSGAIIGTVSGCSAAPAQTAGANPPVLTSAMDMHENVVLQWSSMCLQAIRDTKPGPPMVARALAIVHTCIYEAWAAYDPVAVGARLGGALRRPARERTLANKQQAISYAAYSALVDLFPSETAMFRFLMTEQGYDPDDKSADPTTPTGIGNIASQAVLMFRHTDGSNQLGDLHPGPYSDYTGYHPVNTPNVITNPNRWQPLKVPNGSGGFVVQKYVGPHWGKVIPFALTSGSQFRPGPPPLYPSADYLQEVKQVAQYSADLTDEQKVIAEYWADGPASELPPGHWCLIARFVSKRDHHDLDKDVKLFFMVGNAVFDAGIACWDAKRTYDSVRPVTAVHYMYHGKMIQSWAGPYLGTRLIDGNGWKPYQAPTVVTPAFPEYISGHSTFSAAAAEDLKRFTGSDRLNASYTKLAGTSSFETGLLPVTNVTLSWPTFSAAADQAGLSRRYGGIHFEQGDREGRKVGRLVGAQVWNKALAYINGSA